MALLNDWENATKLDTPARSLSRGLSAVARPLTGNFGQAQQPDIPAADAETYKQQGTSLASRALTPSAVNPVQKPMAQPGLVGGAPANPAAGGLTVSPPSLAKTSQPGVSKVTGRSLSSPLYTNVGDAGSAVDGLKQQADGAAPAQQSGPAAGITVAPFGMDNSQGSMQNEGLSRMAAANAARQSMIDSQPQGGASVLGGLDAMGRTAQERENDEKTARWRQDALISEAKYQPKLAGIAGELIRGDSQKAVEDVRQQGITAGLDTQRRGQDMNYNAQIAQQSLAARAQDLAAARDSSRLGIDMARFGLEKSEADRRAAAGNADWRVQVTPTTKNPDGSTTMGSIYRYNQRTGQTERVDGGNQSSVPIDQNPQAVAIKNNQSMSREQKVAALRALGYS